MPDNRLGELPWLIDTTTGRPNGVRTQRGEEIAVVLLDADSGQFVANGAPIAGLSNSLGSTRFPAELVSLSATGAVCGSPCQIERVRCTSGTSVALTVYDNPAASSGTTLYSGTLSAGQEAAITTPIRAINGVRAVFASGAFDFYISQED